ncbi:hypothetical protein V8F20_006129 [Naviculisporaceae sp. PSN 640]
MAQTSGLLAKGVPPQPVWLFYIKIAILVLSVIILGLAAWAVSIFPYGNGPAGITIFTVIKTFIVYGGALGLELGAPQFFYRIAALVLYALSLIFWLTSWAYCASGAAAFLSAGSWGYYYGWHKNEGAALGASAGLGAIVWILCIVHFVFFIRACLSDPEGNGQNQAELGAVKAEPAVQSYPAQAYPAQPGAQYAQPQQTYVQQPYATQ